MTEITTFVKHEDLIVNVETRGPISGTEDKYVTKVWFGSSEYDSPLVVNFHHTGEDVNILHLLRNKVSERPLEYEDKVHVDTRPDSLTLP